MIDYPKCRALSVCWACRSEGDEDCDVCARGLLDGDNVCKPHRLPVGHSILDGEPTPRRQRRKHMDRAETYEYLAVCADERDDPQAADHRAMARAEAYKADRLTAEINASDEAAGFLPRQAPADLEGEASR